jgi:hypothetical protein
VGRPASNCCAASVSATRCSLRAFIRQPELAQGHRANQRIGIPGQRVVPLMGVLGASVR